MQTQIPQYKILSTIGCGSQHLVYLGKQILNSESYAIKIEKNPQIGQLENEIKILQSLNGIEGVPKLKSIGITKEQKFFFVFPLLHSNLLDLAKSQPLSSTLLLSIGLRVIEILENVHKKNILHLDIKPENIMLSQAYEKESDILNPGFIQLIDFGLSQQYIENSESLQDVFIGSLNFASRSCHDGAPLGYKDDLESLLYVLFYLKDLSLPWSAKQYWGFKNVDLELIRKSKFTFFQSITQKQKSYHNFSSFIAYIDQLKHDVMPDYDYIRELFKQMIQASNNLFFQFKQDQQQSFCTPTYSFKGNSEIQRISNYDKFDLIDIKMNISEKTIILVSNLVEKYNTKQIKSIKDIKF